MQKALDRFWEVVFTPSIRRLPLPNPRIKYYRFPNPGNEPIEHESKEMDYKTAFRDSIHQVRYHKDIMADEETVSANYVADAIGDTTADKLVKFGLITREQASDATVIAEATQQYEEMVGESIDQRVHFDEFGIDEKPITKENRESVAHFVRSFLTTNRDVNAEESWLNNLDDVYNPYIIQFKTYDMFDEPVYRQLKLDLIYQVELFTNKKVAQGYMPAFEGDPKFWNILDSSFTPEQIKQLQNSVGDHESDDLGALAKVHNVADFHGESRIEFPLRSEIA